MRSPARKDETISTRMWTTCGSPGGLRRSSWCRGLKCVLLCALVSGCAHIVKISYPPESVLHPTFDKPYTVWNGERVQVDRTTSLRPESFKYVAAYDRVFLADSIRQRGLRDEFKIEGSGTPLVVFAKNPNTTPEEKHYPTIGIALAITAVKEERRGKVPLLKLYDSLDPIVVRSSSGPHPIAANYAATLAVLVFAYQKSSRKRRRIVS